MCIFIHKRSYSLNKTIRNLQFHSRNQWMCNEETHLDSKFILIFFWEKTLSFKLSLPQHLIKKAYKCTIKSHLPYLSDYYVFCTFIFMHFDAKFIHVLCTCLRGPYLFINIGIVKLLYELVLIMSKKSCSELPWETYRHLPFNLNTINPKFYTLMIDDNVLQRTG